MSRLAMEMLNGKQEKKMLVILVTGLVLALVLALPFLL